MRVLATLVAAAMAMAMASSPAIALTPYEWDLPPRFPEPKVPAENPMTVEGVALGRFLFYDARLSGNQTQSCASCHQQSRAFTDGLERGVGSTGEIHPRNSMSLTNVAYATALAWANPLLVRLEQQILIPLFGENPVEQGLAGLEDELLERLGSDVRYRRLFAEAFPDSGDPISVAHVVRALASFTRSLVSSNSPFDDYLYRLDDFAISDSAKRGFQLFFGERFECFHCHGGFNFSASTTFAGKVFDEVQFDNNGLYNLDGQGAYPPDNIGIQSITGDPRDMGRFRAPTLRNLEYTAPYMHDGTMATVEDVLVDHYARGGRLIVEGANAGDGSLSPLKSPFVRGFEMTEQEKQDMLELLRSLTDERFVTALALSDPFQQAAPPADCDLDGDVSAGDRRRAVRVGLREEALALCVAAETSGDGEVTVDEIVAGVGFSVEVAP